MSSEESPAAEAAEAAQGAEGAQAAQGAEAAQGAQGAESAAGTQAADDTASSVEGAEAAPEERILDLTDPKAMRAVAHPVRMALIELLTVTDSLTATQASEVLGESPANCAFHLRTLAKYGYLTETGGGKGRERPWKLAPTAIHLSTHHEDPLVERSARTLHDFWLGRTLQRAQRILTSPQNLPEGWAGAEESSEVVAFVTADELRELSRDVYSLLGRFKSRNEDPSKRPAGALPVEMVFLAYPVTEAAFARPEEVSGD